ncbi:GlsB/YeaQ/YmgE family stress response membrane protein [Ktedonobacteria bacterium brp13]|nr:GlsB/YeaQ/YmgE family stress response membrane protein [Ktedonobacteria bacterium brp13]
MLTFATSVLLSDINITTIIWWLVVGLIAGVLAGLVMRGGGYGIGGDIVVGLIGALVGGFLANLLGLNSSGSLLYTILIAFIGACILIAILRAVTGGFGRRV